MRQTSPNAFGACAGIYQLEPARGFEPLTFRLQGGCSTAELRRRWTPPIIPHLQDSEP